MLNFVGQVHMGVKGVVFRPDGIPAAYAEIGEIIHSLDLVLCLRSITSSEGLRSRAQPK